MVPTLFIALLMEGFMFVAPPPKTPEEVTAELVAANCERYRPVVEEMYEYFPIDPNVVLAVMAQESSCDPNSMSDDGYNTIGLMQIAAKPWNLAERYLYQPKWNIWQGMYILHAILNNETENPDHDMRRALAAYNCGWASLNAGKCLYFGGPVYADRVLDFWYPYFAGGSIEKVHFPSWWSAQAFLLP